MSTKTRAFLLVTLLGSVLRAADDYEPGPDSKPQEGVPQGDVIEGTFDRSKIFPGTSREYWVYVPKQLDSSKPAPVMAGFTGSRISTECRSSKRRLSGFFKRRRACGSGARVLCPGRRLVVHDIKRVRRPREVEEDSGAGCGVQQAKATVVLKRGVARPDQRSQAPTVHEFDSGKIHVHVKALAQRSTELLAEFCRAGRGQLADPGDAQSLSFKFKFHIPPKVVGDGVANGILSSRSKLTCPGSLRHIYFGASPDAPPQRHTFGEKGLKAF